MPGLVGKENLGTVGSSGDVGVEEPDDLSAQEEQRSTAAAIAAISAIGEVGLAD